MYIIIPGAFNATTQIAGGSQQGQIVTVGSFLKVREKDRKPFPSDLGTPSEIWIDNTAGVGYVCKETNGIKTVWDRLDVLGDFVTFGDSDPGSNTDIRLGYRPGSLRYARNSDTLWICSDNTQGAASWNILSSGSSVISVNGQTGVVELYLDDLLDVNAAFPNDGDVLTWDSSVSAWVSAPPSGGGATYTVDNGLTANTSTNFQLGGGIIQSTTITSGQASSSHGIRFDAPVYLPTGSGIYSFTAFDLLGLYNSSGNSILASFSAQGAISAKILATESTSSGSSVPGLGLFLESQDTVSTPLKIKGTVGDTLLFNNSGQLRLHEYDTSTAFSGVSGTSIGVLNVDNQGKVFVAPGGGGSGTVTSVGLVLDPIPSSPAIQINNSPITTSGDLEIEFLGTPSEYTRGDGSLAPFPSVVAPATVFFGDGFDGTIILNGSNTYSSIMSLSGSTYTLLRSIYPSTLTINSGITLLTNGHQITCNGTMTVDGTVGSIGNNGGNAVNIVGNYSTAGVGGASLKPNTTVTDQILVGPSTGGGNGNSGSSGWGAAGGSISVTWYYYAALGGGGGRGWINSTTQGPASTVTVAASGKFLPYPTTNTGISNHIGWLTVNAINFGGVLVGSGGGGGGGAGANLSGGWGGAGGGGGGGPFGVKILSNILSISATGIIRSNGGNGGNGCVGSGTNWAHGAGGGGANGGIVYIVTNNLSYTPNNQIQSKGGTGGTGGFGAGLGAALYSTNGSSGADGYIHIMNTTTGLSTFYTGQY